MTVQDIRECAQICDDEFDCVAFTYQTNINRCYLKRDFDGTPTEGIYI